MMVRMLSPAICLALATAAAQVPIGDLHLNDVDGIPAPPYGIGTEVSVAGIVTVPTGTFSGIRTEIYLQDATGGIMVYRSDFTHQVALGDSVVVNGTVDQYRGTTRIAPQTVQIIDAGHPTPTPRILTCAEIAQAFQPDFSEPDESRLVRVEYASYDQQTGTISDASGVCVLYIDPDTGISMDSGTYHVTGVLGQWDGELPYTDSYQLMPRFAGDVEPVVGPQFVVEPQEGDIVSTGFSVSWTTDSPAGAALSWGIANPGDLGELVDSTQIPSHLFVLEGLASGTIYRLQARAWNSTGENRSAVWAASTASGPDCTGTMHVYFNQAVDAQYATGSAANGNALLQRRLLDRINGASFSVDACLYNLTVPEITTALITAANRGVQVRVVTEEENYGSEMTRLVAAGIPVLADTAGANDGSGYMHNKFIVFDYLDRSSAADDYVWTGSANITYNGFFENAENVIVVQDQALAGAYTAEFEEMWGSAGPYPDRTLSRFGARKRNNTPHRFLIAQRPVELYMSPSDGCTSVLELTAIGAQRCLYFSIFGFTSTDIEAALRAARDQAGARIAGVFDQGQAGSSSRYWPMNGQGPGAWVPPADVHLLGSYPSMHHKYLLVDADNGGPGGAVATGSYNWSWSAENSNDENLLIVRDEQIANHYLQEFMARYQEAGGSDSLALDAMSAPRDLVLDMVVGPNPWRGPPLVRVRAPGILGAALYDLGGRLVSGTKVTVPQQVLTIHPPALPRGVYVLVGSGVWGSISRPLVYVGN